MQKCEVQFGLYLSSVEVSAMSCSSVAPPSCSCACIYYVCTYIFVYLYVSECICVYVSIFFATTVW